MKIEQLMSRPVHTCRAIDSLDTAARLMWEHDCGAIPVVGEDDRIVGIVTDRDICMAAYTRGQALSSIPVESAMAREVISCAPGHSIDTAEQMMGRMQVRRLPVVAEGRVVGMVSLADLARAAAQTRKSNGAHRAVVDTLAAISAPRRRAIEASPLQAAPDMR